MIERESTRRLVRAFGLAVALGGCATAMGQSNSLFNASRGRGGANGANAPAAGGAMESASPPESSSSARAAVNSELLSASLIAVRLPDARRIQVNDLLTVIVREDRKSVSDAKMAHEKSWDLSSELSAWLRINEEDKLVPQNFPQGTPQVGFNYDSQYDGKGKKERTDTLVTRIAVKVIDIKPNGNLIVQGKKELKLGEETHVATLTGECSTDDVTPQRTLLSTQIYDLRIEMPDAGAVNDATQRGWILRLLDAAKPF